MRDKIFKDEKTEIEFYHFKKNFFPHLFHINDNDDEIDYDQEREQKLLVD